MSTPPVEYSTLIITRSSPFWHLRAWIARRAALIVLKVWTPNFIENAVTDVAEKWLLEVGK